MTEIILHNYPQSPVAEKVRVALGIKQASWRSVEIPRIPPKPNLVKLTGGYRRTPVMQIGADIYCDTQCILRELDRRFPEPGLQPASSAGLDWLLFAWADRPFYAVVNAVMFGVIQVALPGRTFSMLDLAGNLIGVGLAWAFYKVLVNFKRTIRV